MKKISIFLILLMNASCVTWYSHEPRKVVPAVSPTGVTLHYTVFTSDTETKFQILRGLEKSKAFSNYLEHASLKDYVENEKGDDPYYLEVKVDEKKPGPLGVILSYIFSYGTLTIIPGYVGGGVNVEYRLLKYKPNKGYVTAHTYMYDVNRNTFIWILALPFAWINFMTHTKEEIVTLTAQDYMLMISKMQKL